MFDIHNCVNVTVSDCYFLNNSGTGIIQNEPLRGNTGALAITYYNINTSLDDPTIIVSGCNFTNNSAMGEMTHTNQAFSTGIFRGRGGSMGIFINEPKFNIRARVINCSYISSYARETGGGLYILATGRSHNVSIEESLFLLNRAIGTAGGLIFYGLKSNSSFSNSHTFLVTQCQFESNSAATGGALYVGGYGHIVVHINQCKFMDNILTDQRDGTGAAFSNANLISDKYNIHIIITDW